MDRDADFEKNSRNENIPQVIAGGVRRSELRVDCARRAYPAVQITESQNLEAVFLS